MFELDLSDIEHNYTGFTKNIFLEAFILVVSLIMSVNNTPILCYWDIRGLAAPSRFFDIDSAFLTIIASNSRLMLEYSGIGFENRTMVMPKPEWLEMKQSLGFDFPNLPYYQVYHESNLK